MPISFDRELDFLLARRGGQRVDARDDLFDGLVRALERLDHLLLGDLLRARLHHHDGVLAARDDEIEAAAPPLLERGIDHELPVDLADANAGNRPGERDGRERNAADAPVIASTSESFSASAETRSAMTCVS